MPVPVIPSEAVFLSSRSLMRRWDCSKSSVYRMLGTMERLGLYTGILVGKDRRVALSAVEAFERHLTVRATAPLPNTMAHSAAAPVRLRAASGGVKAASSGNPATSFRAVVDQLFGRRPTRARSSRSGPSRRGGAVGGAA